MLEKWTKPLIAVWAVCMALMLALFIGVLIAVWKYVCS